MKIAKLEDGKPEIYHAIQGEGPTLGEPCVFVRFAMCNLQCNFCDTAYTWYFENAGMDKVDHRYAKPCEKNKYMMDMSVEDVEQAIRIAAGKTRRVVFTGGEPLLQQNDMYKVIELLQKDSEDWLIEIETNGTLQVLDHMMIDYINCSPKLASSGNLAFARSKPEVIKRYQELFLEGVGICFKFVVGKDTMKEDLKEIRAWERANDITRYHIYLMPEGITKEAIAEGTDALIDVCRKYGYNLSTRLQVLLYGDKRAV